MSRRLEAAIEELYARTEMLAELLAGPETTPLERALELRTEALQQLLALASGPEGPVGPAALGSLAALEARLLASAQTELLRIREALQETARAREVVQGLPVETPAPRFVSSRA